MKKTISSFILILAYFTNANALNYSTDNWRFSLDADGMILPRIMDSLLLVMRADSILLATLLAETSIELDSCFSLSLNFTAFFLS